jgi:hypothetical protein
LAGTGVAKEVKAEGVAEEVAQGGKAAVAPGKAGAQPSQPLFECLVGAFPQHKLVAGPVMARKRRLTHPV